MSAAWQSNVASKRSPFIRARVCKDTQAAPDWNIIRAVREAVKMPVIGNGDIQRPEDAERMVRETGCNAVMIGRAAATNPWIFQQIEQYVATGRYTEPSELDRYRLLAGYFRDLIAAELPDAIGKMKQFAKFVYARREKTAASCAGRSTTAQTPSEVLQRVEDFFEPLVASSDNREPFIQSPLS